MSRDASTVKIRMFLKRESDKALCYVNKPRDLEVTRTEWIPKSMVEHTTKFPPVGGTHYREHEITLPVWLVEQKDLGEFQV